MSGLKGQRYVGEEFAVIILAPKEDEAVLLAEKAKKGIIDLHIGSPDHFVTVSVGTATMIPKEESPNYLISVADQALYQSKGSGALKYLYSAIP